VSGGALDYCYTRVQDAAGTIAARAKTSEERAFAKHLLLVSKALREIEWDYSGDGSDTAWALMRECVGSAGCLAAGIAHAEEARTALEYDIARAKTEAAK
jgi:hypothetical protein